VSPRPEPSATVGSLLQPTPAALALFATGTVAKVVPTATSTAHSLPTASATPVAPPAATAPASPERQGRGATVAVPPPSPTPLPATATRPVVTATAVVTAAPAPRVGAPLIAIDPGHGGQEVGAVFSGGGLVLREKDVNLAIAQRLAALLRGAGYRVLLTREADTGVNLAGADLTGEGVVDNLDDLQARIDRVNAAGADLLFSIHNNAWTDPGESGSEVYYCPERTYAQRNLALARLLESAFVTRLAAAGYQPRERGVKADTSFRYYDGRPYCASLLGPVQLPRRPRATQMPAALGESLFLSHPEGALLARADVQQAIAQAYFDAASGYFARFPWGS
jgi:N-acetylmuramoyl-L-alanine amidase